MIFIWATLIKVAFTIGWVMTLASFLTWVERKQSAVMQDRIGANRANLGPFRAFGLFQIIADAVKSITKEDWVPRGGNKFLHTMGPAVSFFFSMMPFAAIPVADHILYKGQQIPAAVVSSNLAILFVFSMLSLEIYGAVFAGYSSNNNYSLMGGLRASAQMFSYEITFGATIIGLVMIFGSLDLHQLVRSQQGLLLGFYPRWGVFLQPLGFLLFVTAGLAETKRVPFDLPEGESEIIGYFLEYSGLKFAMFLMVDFIETIMIASLTTLLFFGGWNLPFLAADGFHFGSAVVQLAPVWVTVIQAATFFIKVSAFVWLFLLIRWTLPRFRYDQLMRLGWNYLLPFSLLNIFVTGLILILWDQFHA